MSKTTIVVSGKGASVTFNGVAINNINTIGFSVIGEKPEIDLTTIDNVAYRVGLLGDLQKIEDIVINKKTEPSQDNAISGDNAQLAITFKVGGSSTKIVTFWAQRKNGASSTLERGPSEGINRDVTFFVTNLNGSLVETGPAITS